jgi:hypothetical protein
VRNFWDTTAAAALLTSSVGDLGQHRRPDLHVSGVLGSQELLRFFNAERDLRGDGGRSICFIVRLLGLVGIQNRRKKSATNIGNYVGFFTHIPYNRKP